MWKHQPTQLDFIEAYMNGALMVEQCNNVTAFRLLGRDYTSNFNRTKGPYSFKTRSWMIRKRPNIFVLVYWILTKQFKRI